MTTSYFSKMATPVADISEIPVAKRGEDINVLLYDLLTTVSPYGTEEKVAKIIIDYVKKVSPDATHNFDTEGNLHIKLGKDSRTMFSSHMDTVQKATLGDKTTLHLSPELFVSASVSKSVQQYFNKDGKAVSELDMKTEARAAGHSYTHYTLPPAETREGRSTTRFLHGSNSAFDGWNNTDLEYDTKMLVKPVSCILGADDKLGIYTMCKLIEAGVEGLYVFHVGEEVGGIGSRWLAKNHPDMFRDYDHCVAFDRMNYGDIITHQSGGRCCSDEFADALADQMNASLPPMQQMKGSPNGSFTDSASYTSLIPECTNVSVGYFGQHTANENFDLHWLEHHFIPAILKVNWSELPVVREAAAPPASGFQMGKESYSRNYGYNRGSYTSPKSVVPARGTTTRERKRQSNLDKASNVLSNIESYCPDIGFFAEETALQQRDRVLYTFINDEMSLQDMADMVVDADYYGQLRGEHRSLPLSGGDWREDDFWHNPKF